MATLTKHAGQKSLFDYAKLSKKNGDKLKEIEITIISAKSTALDKIIEMGQGFLDAKALLNHGEFTNWISARFNESMDTVQNYMNVAKEAAAYPERVKLMHDMAPGGLYKLLSGQTSEEVKNAIFTTVSEGLSFTAQEIQQIRQLTTKFDLAELEIPDDVQNIMLESDNFSEVIDSPSQIKAIARLSKKSQKEVVNTIASGNAHSPKQALQFIKAEKKTEEVILSQPPIEEKKTTKYLNKWTKSIKQVASESVDLMFVECPFNQKWVDGTEAENLQLLTREAEIVLKPGGLMVAMMGHKSMMYCGQIIEEGQLKPLHIFTARKTPGNSSSIVGINITSATLLSAIAYKPPYRAPEQMLVDLQSFDVDNKLEWCFENLLNLFLDRHKPLDEQPPTFAYVLASAKTARLKLEDGLLAHAQSLGAVTIQIGS